MMHFALTTVLALAQDCPDFASCPAVVDLHAVRWNYGERYQDELARIMSGDRAHPLFNRAINQADVHWRLLAATGEGLELTGADAAEWRDVALAGSFLAFDSVVNETFARAPELDALRLAIDTIISPSIDVVVKKDGRVSVRHPTGWDLGQRIERQEQEAGFEPRNGRRKSKFHLGLGWKLRDLEAEPGTPVLSWAAHAAVQNLGISLVRADMDVLTLQWDALARQRLFAGVSVVAQLNSGVGVPDPDRWSMGLLWSPRPRWVFRLERTQPLERDGWRYDLTARLELGGRLPGLASAPVAGLPVVQNTRPNRLAPPWRWPGG